MTQFKPGESGNPDGRPKGIRDRRILFSEMILPHKKDLLKKATKMALNGNEPMLKLLLDRLLPARPKENPLSDIDDLTGSLTEQCDKILSLVSDGAITTTEGMSLLQAIKIKSELVEVDDIKKRMIEIERILKQRGKE